MCSSNRKLKGAINNLQCFHLITKYEVAKAEVSQYKWEDKWSYNGVREPKKSKQENPRNFTMIVHRWSFWVFPLATLCAAPPQVIQKGRSLSEFWCYTCPWSHHICNKERCLQNHHETNDCLATHMLWHRLKLYATSENCVSRYILKWTSSDSKKDVDKIKRMLTKAKVWKPIIKAINWKNKVQNSIHVTV